MERLPRCDALDSSAAAAYLKKPDQGRASYPFALKKPNSGSEGAFSTVTPGVGASGRKGKRPNHAIKEQKYSADRIPAPIVKLLKNSWPLIGSMKRGRWKKIFLRLFSSALAKSTWAKYSAAVNMYQTFCKSQLVPFKLPISQETGNSLIVWAAGGGKLGSGTVRAYLTALHSLGRLFNEKKGGEGGQKNCC